MALPASVVSACIICGRRPTSRSDCLKRGLCRSHYQEIRNAGKLDEVGLPVFWVNGGACSVESCDKEAICKGMCQRHYDDARIGRVSGIDWWADIKPGSAHVRIRRLWGPASNYDCIECGGQAKQWAYDGTDPSQLYGPVSNGDGATYWIYYSRFPEFYMPMCVKCHKRRDAAKAAAELRAYRFAQMTPPPRRRSRTASRPANRRY